jgi:hypothetical protein
VGRLGSTTLRRPVAIVASALALAACGAVLQAPSPAAAAPTAGPLTPFIVGGQ